MISLVITASAQERLISVGPNVRISAARSDWAHTEMNIAADPDDPKHLIACSIFKSQKPYQLSSIVYVSFDGGNTWTPTLEATGTPHSSDPNCTIGPTGAAYFITDARTMSLTRVAKVYRSKDGGKSWLPPVSLPSFLERPSIITDTRDGTNIFVNGWSTPRDLNSGKGLSAIGLSRSLDAGASFENPINGTPFENDRHYPIGMGNCVMLSDDNLVCTIIQSDDDSPIDEQAQSIRLKAKIRVLTASQQGAVLSNALSVASTYILRRPPGSTNFSPVIAVDPSNGPLKDRLYLVWTDVTAGRTQISFAYSADKGKTWSNPKYINDDQTFDALDPSQGPDDFMPVVAVNRNGVVGVMWYDRRENKDNLGWFTRFTASLDGGESFLPSVRVSEAPAVFGPQANWPIYFWRSISGGGSKFPGGSLTLDLQITGQFFNGGDYAGMATDANGVFHPIWADNRTGLHQLWTSAIKVNAQGRLHGSLEPAQLVEITDKVSLEILSTNYDRQSDILTCEVRLTNTSTQKLDGPFKVKFVSLTSDVGGQIKLVGDKDSPVFEMATPDNQLQPGESSQSKKLTFHLTNIQPLKRGRDIKLGLAKADLIVLGRTP